MRKFCKKKCENFAKKIINYDEMKLLIQNVISAKFMVIAEIFFAQLIFSKKCKISRKFWEYEIKFSVFF